MDRKNRATQVTEVEKNVQRILILIDKAPEGRTFGRDIRILKKCRSSFRIPR